MQTKYHLDHYPLGHDYTQITILDPIASQNVDDEVEEAGHDKNSIKQETNGQLRKSEELIDGRREWRLARLLHGGSQQGVMEHQTETRLM